MATAILTALAVFQLLLVKGLPLGRFAWGGGHTVLPPRLRVASALSVALYALFVLVILSKAGIIFDVSGSDLLSAFLWIVTGYFGVGAIMNGMSRSKPERLMMTPVALVLGVLCLIVAMR